jgi:hypothetical protein
MRAEDLCYFLDENYEADAYAEATFGSIVEEKRAELTEVITEADLITLNFSNNTITEFMMNQTMAALDGKAAEMDWNQYLSDKEAALVEEALAEMTGYFAGAGLGEEMAAVLTTAVESYAYAYVGFAVNYAEMLNDIHEINPEAEVIVVGSYNAFPELGIEMQGEETVVGEYVDYLIELMDMQYLVYAMVTPNTTFVEVNETEVEKAYTGISGVAMDLLLSGTKLYPSAEGHEYIKTEILKSLNITVDGLLGDVNLDGKVNAIDATQILRKCNNKASVFTYAKGYKLELYKYVSDVDADGEINAVDATQILRYCNNKPCVLNQK